MKKILSLAIIAAIAIAFALTNPDKKAHTDAVSETLSGIISDNIPGGSNAEKLAFGLVSSLLTNKVVDNVLESQLIYKNYIFFSTGSIHWDGEDKMVSFGMLNNVYSFGGEQVQGAIDKVKGLKH